MPYFATDLELVTADRVRKGDVLAKATATPGLFDGRPVIAQPRRDGKRPDVYEIACTDVTYRQPVGMPVRRVRRAA